MPEWRVDRRDILGGHAFVGEIGAQNPVGGSRIDIIGSKQNPAANLATFLADQIANGRNRLLIWRGAGVEDIARAFFAFVLNGIEKQTVESLEDRNNGLSGARGPATEYDRDLFPCKQFVCLVREGDRVRRRVDDDRFEFPAEQPALPVLVR